jgi:hypothetical protein
MVKIKTLWPYCIAIKEVLTAVRSPVISRPVGNGIIVYANELNGISELPTQTTSY